MMTASRRFHVTIVHPCVGRTAGMKKYIRTWRMQPLPAAAIAGLLPRDVDRRFFDDRLDTIDYDAPTDLVLISVETYTAKRSYQIASAYRARGIPVVMGGFHATLCPDEVEQYAESVVIGEAEDVLAEVLEDYRHGRARKRYQADARPQLSRVKLDRSIFQGKKYLPIGLVEYARGCRFKCEFCAVQKFFNATQLQRPIDAVIEEVRRVHRKRRLIFFIDDNICSDIEAAKAFMRALIPLGIRWVSQSSINAGFDEEALSLMKQSGCQGLLVGLESLDRNALRQMNKGFNLMQGGAEPALANFHRHGLRIYGTFIFGYDSDTPETIASTVAFAQQHGLFIAAFNHITPFPGTPLYERMQKENRLLYDAWWLDERYRYNMVPFQPRHMSPTELEKECLNARRAFYGWPSIWSRARHRVNRQDLIMSAHFLAINAMHQRDVVGRSGLPLGDETHAQPLIGADV